MGQSGGEQSVYRVRPSAECKPIPNHLLPGVKLSHDEQERVLHSAVQPDKPDRPYAGRGIDETGSTERHAACGFSLALERCVHGDRECVQAAGPAFPLQIRSRDEYLHRPTEEDEEEGSFDRHQDHSIIASLVSWAGSWQALSGGRQWMNPQCTCSTSSRVRVSKPKVSIPSSLLLFPTSNRVRHPGCCMAPFSSLWVVPLGQGNRNVSHHPHACCSVPRPAQAFLFRCVQLCDNALSQSRPESRGDAYPGLLMIPVLGILSGRGGLFLGGVYSISHGRVRYIGSLASGAPEGRVLIRELRPGVRSGPPRKTADKLLPCVV